MQDLSIKQRYASRAVWINCLAPGLGLYYLGERRQALWFLLLTSLPWFILLLLPWRHEPQMLIAATLVSLFILALSMLYSWQQASRQSLVIIGDEQHWYGYGLFWLSFIFICLLWLALMVWRLGWLPYQVQTGSMQQTLPDKDWVVLDTSEYELSRLNRGDIVLFQHPETGDQTLQRIIGLPGERITVHGGGLFIDGSWISEPYISEQLNQQRIPQGVVEMTVPEQALFVMADNRDNSRDSRYWGAIKWADIQGAVIYHVDFQSFSSQELLKQLAGLSFSE